MSDKDPPPFGYTFSSDFFAGASTPLDSHGQSLLSDMEGQSLADFFSNTDPFSLADGPPFAAPDTKLAGSDFNDWNFMAPATVHQVSATIPDQAQLHHGYDLFAPLDMGTTHDDLQAAETLFNTQHPQPAYRHSFHDGPSGHHPTHSVPTHGVPRHSVSSHSGVPTHNGRPMVATAQGLLPEPLAALLPNHGAAGTLDAQLAAQWAGSDAHHIVQEEFGVHRPSLKRTYTFGTDDSFSNPAGFSAPHAETEEHVTQRLLRDMAHTQAFIPLDAKPSRSPSPSDSDTPSSTPSSPPSKKRKKPIKPDPLRKTTAARIAKPKPPDDKKKRAASSSSAAQKLQRENLSEAQKRSNHILSEQKRRNLIKRGFDDLHDLVPEIRTGGLSKSSVLTEAANFLDQLVAGNAELGALLGR
ncbi:hypothetical protein C7974DRAFT_401310 [Boeremia exigua]|uniref:uncharacterized protein n=1 Tax=Boeremia exigua TaxID=749465 RepID=UPI001E8D1177|nr:uncharacterized protein C7974DRAFT_401310 [Boeremia exigua]KAH6619002.1 hypothetical protein C7974DRAFT_401310 [Boeremia exigua]